MFFFAGECYVALSLRLEMQKAILCGRPQTTVGGAVQKTLEGKSREQFGVDVDAVFLQISLTVRFVSILFQVTL